MDRLAKAKEILSDIFEMDISEITEDKNRDDMEDWDSMASAQIIMMLELECGIHFSDSDIANLNSFKDIFQIVSRG